MNKTIYIAFVCTGNTCRSPMAEAIFNSLAENTNKRIIAESFGINTITGLPVSDNSKSACKEIDIDISNFTSTSINDVDLKKYSKFYCMSKSHAEVLILMYGIKPEYISVLNISDPYGGSLETYRQCRDEIYNSVKEIILQINKS